MSEILRQVCLERSSPQGKWLDVAWIDPDLARVGKRVRTEDGEVWTVVEVYGTKRKELIEITRATKMLEGLDE